MGFRRRYQGFFAWTLTAVLTATVTVGIASPVGAQSWMNLLLQGLQVIQLSNLSDQQEVRLGQQINQQLYQRGEFRPHGDRQLQSYINEIGQRLARTSSRPNIPYTFQVVDDRRINAFATMGGFVYVNTGLIAAAENEAELASVIAHEIAHIAERHAVTRMRDVGLSQGLISAAGMRENNIVQMAMQLGFNLPMSREDELSADAMGLRNLVRAGYAPAGMVSFMEKLQRQSGAAPEFLSSHPLTQNRITSLRRSIPPQYLYQGDGLDSQAYSRRIGRQAPTLR
ncbi:M48 family metallopeptidase [Synechocystis salina LEGE 06099]|uniref:M48 family metallopeptidase n=1 Tax=Synechocystis salina TaxID=945780 RepID=UPI001882B45D|nr:M48 family metalloprotease [Synechocystis salina]MBE9204248.1 M48 family metallopeptidase [Synechocystis salina LEGE 06099]